MLSTTEYNGSVNIEGESLVRDLKSKAILPTDRRALLQYRRQRDSALVEMKQKQDLRSDVQRINADIQNLKAELVNIKDLLMAALPVLINNNKP